MTITRRSFGMAAAIFGGLAAATLGYDQIFGRKYPSTPYDDLLDQIVDRQPAARLGKAVIPAMPDFDAEALAAQLRQPGFDLQRRARTDAAAGRLFEADGWVLPQSVARYAALAAQA